jgi:hypothetical protein
MIAFTVWKNGKLLTVAGAGDLSVLSAGIAAVGPLGPETWTVHSPARDPVIHLHVGGLTSRSKDAADEHLHWVKHLKLTPGDKITVLVTRAERTSPIVGSTRAVRKTPAPDQFDAYNKLAEKYLRLKKKLAAKRTKRAPKKAGRKPRDSGHDR